MKISCNYRSVSSIVAKPRSCFYNIFYREVLHSRVRKCKSLRRSAKGQQIAESLLLLPFLAVFLFMVTRTEKMIKLEKVQWELHFVLPFHQISHKKMLKASFYLVHDLARLAEQKLAAKTSSKSCRLFHSSSHEENKPLQVSLPAVWNRNESPTLRKKLDLTY